MGNQYRSTCSCYTVPGETFHILSLSILYTSSDTAAVTKSWAYRLNSARIFTMWDMFAKRRKRKSLHCSNQYKSSE